MLNYIDFLQMANKYDAPNNNMTHTEQYLNISNLDAIKVCCLQDWHLRIFLDNLRIGYIHRNCMELMKWNFQEIIEGWHVQKKIASAKAYGRHVSQTCVDACVELSMMTIDQYFWKPNAFPHAFREDDNHKIYYVDVPWALLSWYY